MAMQPYGNRGGDSPIAAFRIGKDAITVRFADGATYVYDAKTPGREHVAEMQRLALAGSGLATYISQHVRERYARKLKPAR